MAASGDRQQHCALTGARLAPHAPGSATPTGGRFLIARPAVMARNPGRPGCRPRAGDCPGRLHLADFTAKVHSMTGQTDNDYSIRQGAYDLRKLRGKSLVAKRSRPPPRASRCRPRTVAALLAIRDQVIAPLLAEVRSPRRGRPPATWTGPASTGTTTPFTSACRPCSGTSASPPTWPRHRQHLVDRGSASC